MYGMIFMTKNAIILLQDVESYRRKGEEVRKLV